MENSRLLLVLLTTFIYVSIVLGSAIRDYDDRPETTRHDLNRNYPGKEYAKLDGDERATILAKVARLNDLERHGCLCQRGSFNGGYCRCNASSRPTNTDCRWEGNHWLCFPFGQETYSRHETRDEKVKVKQ